MDTMNHDEEKNPVRRVLKSLPEVRASEGFEMRLQRRIRQVGRETEDQAGEKKLLGLHIPSYALSLTVIVVVGLVAYYSLLRRGLTPANDATGSEERKSEVQTGRHDTALHPTAAPQFGISLPSSSRTEPSDVSVVGDSKARRTLSRSRESAQEELLKHGALQQVGGTSRTESPQPFGMPGLPTLRRTQRIGTGKMIDSAASSSDTSKRNSSRRSGEAVVGAKKK